MNDNITIVQIAKESGVSIATVSRVINGTVPVSPQTKAKVEAVIQKYNYQTNSISRRLISTNYHAVAVMLPDIRNPYFSTLYLTIKAILENAGYITILYNSAPLKYSELPADKEIEYFHRIMKSCIDGVIILGGHCNQEKRSEAYLSTLKELAEKMPVLLLSHSSPDIHAFFYPVETTTSLLIALKYLVSQGHRRIGLLGGDPSVHSTQLKIESFRKMAEEIGYQYETDLIATSDYQMEGGYLSATKILQLKDSVTAIIAISDISALGALRACADYGKTVPQDISLISCFQTLEDDYLTPKLTSVDCHIQEIGINISRTLLALLQHQPVPELKNTYPKLIVRESSASPSL